MSLWDSFKKQINESWSGLDFWDEEENRQQRQQFAQPKPNTPSNTGGVRVSTPQRPVGLPMLGDLTDPGIYSGNNPMTRGLPQTSVLDDDIASSKNPIMRDIRVTPTNDKMAAGQIFQKPQPRDFSAVDKSLDAGKSWEDISRETGIPLEEVKGYSQKTRPNYGMPGTTPQRFVGFDLDQGKNKTIFGWNAAALLPKDYEKTYSVKTGREFDASEDTFLKQFDNLSDEFRNVYVGDLQKQVEGGNENAKRTLDTLNRYGRLKGDFSDFLEGANERFYGGLSRGTARTVDFVLPGVNTGGLENWADSYEQPRQVTEMGKTGETAGTGLKGTFDVASMVIPSMWVDKFAKAARYANTGSKIINYGGRILPGSVTAGGIDLLQEVGRGNEANPTRSIGVGAAVDLATPVLLKPISKVAGKVLGPARNQIAKLLNRGGEQVIEEVTEQTGKEVPVMVKMSDELRNAPNINPQLSKVSSQNVEFGADTLGTDLDVKTVQKYVDDIKAGRPIDPLVVSSENGQILLQDGKHRMAALQALDIDEMPVVYRQTPTTPIEPGAGPVTGKTQSISELLPDLASRREVTQSMDEVLSKQYGVSEQMIRRLRNGYGDQTTQNLLARTSDATNIRDMDAFVWSEAKKNYGSPNVRIQRQPKPSDLPPPAEGLEVKQPTPPVKINTDMPKPQSKLGSMAEEFYEKAKGNNRVSFKNLEQLGQNISRQIDDEFTAIGSDFSDVARRVQEGSRNGVKSLDDVLTPDEAQILRKAQAEMNYIRRRASLGSKEVGTGNFGEMYLPQQGKGQYGGERLFEGFRETKPGSEFARKGRIDLEDLDYSPDVIGQYITRYGDTKLYQQERIARALARNNPNVDDEVVQKAAGEVINLQGRVNNLKTKIGAFGFGSRKILSEGKRIDTAAELNKIGKTLGKTQTDVVGAPKGLTNGERINSVMVGNKTVADTLGLNQYRDAQSFASKQIADAAGDRTALSRAVEQRLIADYNLMPDDIEYIVGGISRMADNVPEEVVLARVTSTYRMAAKQQLMEQLQSVNIQNPKLRRDISDLTNQILREGSIEDQLSNKVVRGVLRTQNAIFRKLNVSSALNELSDLTSFLSVYGKDTSLVPDFRSVKEFGLGEIDAAIEPYIKQVQEGRSLPSVLKTINKGTNLYKFVEAYKAGVVASSAKKFYGARGLQGDELVTKVLEDYRKLALPVDAFTKTFLDHAPLYTQYMTWGLRNLQKEGRLATGKIAAGQLLDKSALERAARNAYTNLPAKTVFWLSSNALKGTAILTAFGLTDFTGMTNQDYSGIDEQDKSLFDKVAKYTNTSTTLSLLNRLVQGYEKEQLKEKYANADYNPYEDNQFDKDIIDMYTPQFVKNINNTNDVLAKGYSENKGGRVQYEAPESFWDTARSWVFGKSNTNRGREYTGRLNIIDRVARGDNPLTAAIDMAKEQVGVQEPDYMRPLTDDYSVAYKEGDDQRRKVLLEGGRAFNGYLDNLKKESPKSYNKYIQSMDGNHVNPEYWKTISGGDGGTPDLTIFGMVRDRKKQLAKDLGKAYDPIYDLTDEQARAVLQQKSVATGDDIALRNSLYKEQWYKDYMDKVKGYYDSKTEEDGDFEQTQRVKDWYALNDEYNGFRTLETDDGQRPAWSQQFPTVYAQKIINEKYGFDSEQSKNFFRTYGDQYQAEKDAYDEANLALINKMRAIEGYPAMSTEQYAQVTEIADTDKSDDDDSYGSKKGSGFYAKEGDFGRKRALELPSAKIKVTKVSKKPKSAPKTVKIQRNKKPKTA